MGMIEQKRRLIKKVILKNEVKERFEFEGLFKERENSFYFRALF